jgi:hypothetical protein
VAVGGDAPSATKIIAEERMSNTDNDTPKPAESGPLDLAEIEARLKAITPGPWSAADEE